MEGKLCKECGETKPHSEYSRESGRCKPCRAKASRADYAKHRESRIVKMREWHDANRERHRELSRKNYYRRAALGTFPKPAPEKRRARNMVAQRVRTGAIVKPTHCPDCGKETPKNKMHGHHTDYSKPLDVKWTCSLCHGRAHRRVQVSHSAQTGATA